MPWASIHPFQPLCQLCCQTIVLTLARAVPQQNGYWQECLLHGNVKRQANGILLTRCFEVDVMFFHSLFLLFN